MKYIGHTLFNDERYGGEKILKGTPLQIQKFVENCFKILPRQALHAKTLVLFIQKQTFMSFSCDLPSDIEHCIQKWATIPKHVQ